jgi:hypothetical protein
MGFLLPKITSFLFGNLIYFLYIYSINDENMNQSEIQKIVFEVYEKITKHYGESKHQKSTPYIVFEDSPYDDADDKDLIGEYCSMMNEIVVYWKNIPSSEVLIRTMVHEYQHYLQSPSWMTRYYNMGYGYNDHPYEVQAYNEEENWVKFV